MGSRMYQIPGVLGSEIARGNYDLSNLSTTVVTTERARISKCEKNRLKTSSGTPFGCKTFSVVVDASFVVFYLFRFQTPFLAPNLSLTASLLRFASCLYLVTPILSPLQTTLLFLYVVC